MYVMKFGGSSLESSDSLERVCGIINHFQTSPRVVVVSAMGKTTDALALIAQLATTDLPTAVEQTHLVQQRHIEMVHELLRESASVTAKGEVDKLFDQLIHVLEQIASEHISARLLDAVLSVGELLSSVIVTHLLLSRGVPARWVDSRQVIVTDDRFGSAAPLMELSYGRLQTEFGAMPEKSVPVMGGFIGATREGQPTTLGRGGSDYTAALVGAAVGATDIQIWTDVDGVLSCDPRICAAGATVPELNYRQAALLAQFGAKVLHPATMWPATDMQIPISVRNSRNPQSSITVVGSPNGMEGNSVRAIACKKGIAMLEVRPKNFFFVDASLWTCVSRCLGGVLNEDAQCFRFADRIVLLLAQTEALAPAIELLRRYATIAVRHNQAVMALVGSGLHVPWLQSKVLMAGAELGMEFFLGPGGDTHIVALLPENSLASSMQVLHERLISGGPAFVGYMPFDDEFRESPGAD